MGFDDKAENKAEDLKGRAKEAAGAVTGDDELKTRAAPTRPSPRSSRPARRPRTPSAT